MDRKKKSHTTHSYPADKPLPLERLQGENPPTPAQRKAIKRQHNRRARQYRKNPDNE